MPTAFNLLSERFAEGGDPRADHMAEGLTAAGYDVKRCHGDKLGLSHCKPDDERDVMIMWTRSRHSLEGPAQTFEKAGGRVIVAEESHFKDMMGKDEGGKHRKIFSLCLHDHNGAGTWPHYGPNRWSSFGLERKPWREDGDYILLCGQRGIGSALMHSPDDWHLHILPTLKSRSSRPVHVRAHPKSRLPGDQKWIQSQPESLDEHLAGAWAVVVWSSGVGTKALMEGIPVFYAAPHSFVEGSAQKLQEGAIDDPNPGDRLPVFERLAWSQWRTDEIRSGEAFERLLGS